MKRGRPPKNAVDQDITHSEETSNEVVKNPIYTCADCKGEGLKDQQTLCPRCHGTGIS